MTVAGQYSEIVRNILAGPRESLADKKGFLEVKTVENHNIRDDAV